MPRIQKVGWRGRKSSAPIRPASSPETGRQAGRCSRSLTAIDPDGREKWRCRSSTSRRRGMLATAGGLVPRQADQREVMPPTLTGQTLWQFKTGSSVNATAITYAQRTALSRSRQAAAACSRGHGTEQGATGGSIWTFALMENSAAAGSAMAARMEPSGLWVPRRRQGVQDRTAAGDAFSTRGEGTQPQPCPSSSASRVFSPCSPSPRIRCVHAGSAAGQSAR
jgi:hypothetical protein